MTKLINKEILKSLRPSLSPYFIKITAIIFCVGLLFLGNHVLQTRASANLIISSATLATDGKTITVNIGGVSGSLSPASGIGGFTVRLAGLPLAWASSTSSGSAITIHLKYPILAGRAVTLDLGASPVSNLTDGSGNTPQGQTNFIITNNSAQTSVAKKTIYLTATASTTWKGVQTDGSAITVECIGGGGGGGSDGSQYAGGGGEYRRSTVAYTSGSSVTIQIGAGGSGGSPGTPGGANGIDTIFGANVVVAKAGKGALSNGVGGTGGTGTIGFNGGSSGVSYNGGGGGAGGPNGAGANGGIGDYGGGGGGGADGGTVGGNQADPFGGDGGNNFLGVGHGLHAIATDIYGADGWNGGGGGGGWYNSGAGFGYGGGSGGAGVEWNVSHGSGGGGGGGGYNNPSTQAGNGGLYGGGGGNSSAGGFGGSGAQGIIVITYTPPTNYIDPDSLDLTYRLQHGTFSGQLFTVATGFNEDDVIYANGAYHLFYDAQGYMAYRTAKTREGLASAADVTMNAGGVMGYRYPAAIFDGGLWHIWGWYTDLNTYYFTSRFAPGNYSLIGSPILNNYADIGVRKGPDGNFYAMAWDESQIAHAHIFKATNINGPWTDMGDPFSVVGRADWHNKNNHYEYDCNIFFYNGAAYLAFDGQDSSGNARVGISGFDINSGKATDQGTFLLDNTNLPPGISALTGDPTLLDDGINPPTMYFSTPTGKMYLQSLNTSYNAYNLIYTAGANGTISGVSPQTVLQGSSSSAVTAVPNTGYHFVNWSDTLSTSTSRTDTNVVANISATANFAINTYTITATAGPHGTITPSGTITKNYLDSQSFTIATTTGYHAVNILVDGSPIGTTTLGYTFSSISANHTIAVTFNPSAYTLTFNGNGSTGGSTAAESMVYNIATALTANGFTRTSYIFAGWNTAANG